MSMEPAKSFSVTYDTATKIISAVVCAILLVVVVATGSLVAGCLSALMIALCYAFSPRGYIVSERSILVRRLIGNIIVPCSDIFEARAAAPGDLKGCIRLFGSGGLFGYYGLFRTSKLGKCTWYVTNRKKAAVLITRSKTAVFSPDDVEGFVAAIRAHAPIPDGRGNELASRSARRAPDWTWIIVTGIGILALLLAAGALLYSPGPPKYTLSPEALTIHDRFYPVTLSAADVDAEHIRIVDISVDNDWRPTLRTNGFSNAHYHAGWYRVAGGKKVRMYRADSRRLVLIPPKAEGVPVLIEVEQPETFIQKLRQAWP
jgi:hypothetical protein